MCYRSSSSRLTFSSLLGLLIYSSSTASASWTTDLADKAAALLDSTLQMGQGMSSGGKAFGEAAAQILRKPVGGGVCKANGDNVQEVATFAAGCFWSGVYVWRIPAGSLISLFFFLSLSLSLSYSSFPCFRARTRNTLGRRIQLRR